VLPRTSAKTSANRPAQNVTRPGGRAPDAQRRAALAPGERRGKQRQRRREHRRTADALQRAREVQRRRARRQAAQQRGDGEEAQAGDEHRPPAEAVGQRSGRQQECGERQRIGVDDPLQVLERRAEVLLDVGQRDVDDRHVEQQHERRDADGAERPPAVRVGGGGGLGAHGCGVNYP
jgi:hypothetical protein